MGRKKGSINTKSTSQRTLIIPLRVSGKELELLTELCKKRKAIGSNRWSRTDVIIDALRFASGEAIF